MDVWREGAEGILEEIGWGGRIRTFTILINSEVSYRLDHAPAGFCSGSFGEGRSQQAKPAKWNEQGKNNMGQGMSKDGMEAGEA